MSEDKQSRYLTLTEWLSFKNNDWKHLNWKVDVAIGLLLVILAAALTKLFS